MSGILLPSNMQVGGVAALRMAATPWAPVSASMNTTRLFEAVSSMRRMAARSSGLLSIITMHHNFGDVSSSSIGAIDLAQFLNLFN
jgi:hypothetical protein